MFVAEVSLAFVVKRNVSINLLQVDELEIFGDKLPGPVCPIQVISRQQ
jgi:hypothetical protein